MKDGLITEDRSAPERRTQFTRWDFITCEFPPEIGGVSDYTRQLAVALSERDLPVEVWSRGFGPSETLSKSLTIHRVFGKFRPKDLFKVDRIWHATGTRRSIFLQWVPSGYGYRALNIFFCLWLVLQVLKGHRLRVMFHEVAYPFSAEKLHWRLMGVIHRIMAAILLNCSDLAFASTAKYSRQLAKYSFRRHRIDVLPVPSNVPECTDIDKIKAARAAIAAPKDILIGHFGQYNPFVEKTLTPSLGLLLARNPQYKVLFIGKGSAVYQSSLLSEYPDLSLRIHSTNTCSLAEAAEWIAACDCVFQPYQDGGPTTRRTTAMAVLANGVPLVCTAVVPVDPIWRSTNAVYIVPSKNPDQIAKHLESICSGASPLANSAAEAKAFYQDNFSLAHLIKTLVCAS